ncbi:hypothetical protein BB560_002098 [Smittium megazygosporum]|uniref:Non-structural maintenance of chromosomes element 1 homolog n=1 Tax=Smittium megazygosporum TaxID=133381 RepID=A0A2T9ZFT6_9FUNG|nr:hypothetical protein BB560_002098 [Smittium megazygosporum]
MTNENNSFSITYHEALRKANEVGVSTFKAKEAQKSLEKFAKEQWLESDKGRFLLGNRALCELRVYLLDFYPEEILDCYVCNNIATKGFICGYCGKAIHTFCHTELSNEKNSSVCLNCNKDYDPTDSVIGLVVSSP